jgi:hypothetical protein
MGGLKFYEQGLSQNYIKVMRFLRNGLLRDGKSTGINHQHIQYIRSRIWKSFGQNRLFGKINSVYKVAGFSEIKLADEPLPDFFEGQYNSLTLRYVKDDLNDEMIKIMSEIFDELGIKLNPQETPKIDPDDKTADIVIENIYVFEPSFFNIKYYEEWYNYYNDKGSNIWGGGILYKEIKDSIQSENLKDYEYKMLNTLPVIFLYKYPAQIGYKNIVPNRSRKVLEQEIKGTPFFFYNVINWRLCND